MSTLAAIVEFLFIVVPIPLFAWLNNTTARK